MPTQSTKNGSSVSTNASALRGRRSRTAKPSHTHHSSTGSAMTSVKREPSASAVHSATSQPRRWPASSHSASSRNATADVCAMNHTSPSIEHHSRSVPAKKKATSQIVARLVTPMRSSSAHAAPTASPHSRHASSVWFAAVPAIITSGKISTAGTGSLTM